MGRERERGHFGDRVDSLDGHFGRGDESRREVVLTPSLARGESKRDGSGITFRKKKTPPPKKNKIQQKLCVAFNTKRADEPFKRTGEN